MESEVDLTTDIRTYVKELFRVVESTWYFYITIVLYLSLLVTQGTYSLSKPTKMNTQNECMCYN